MMVVEELSNIKEEAKAKLTDLEKKVDNVIKKLQEITSRMKAIENKLHDVSRFVLNSMHNSATTLCLLQESTLKGKGKED